MTSLIFHMWHEFFHNIWTTRNAILHKSNNTATQTLDSQLDDQLLWYLSNREALSRAEQRLITYSRDTLPTLPLQVKKELKRQLDIAKTAGDIERMQLARSQTVLTKFFTRTNTSDAIMVT
jgi:hypothetical protein